MTNLPLKIVPIPREPHLFNRGGVLLILVVLQLWLFTATMNAWLGGDEAVVAPAAIVSLVCFVLNVGLLRYLYKMEA